jgi:hypothetical protein
MSNPYPLSCHTILKRAESSRFDAHHIDGCLNEAVLKEMIWQDYKAKLLL